MVKVTFIDSKGEARTVEGDAGSTLMETAVRHSIPEILAECGGACACATCHVYVDDVWLPKIKKAEAMEEDMLDFASELKSNSRLSCQITLSDQLNGIVVTTPATQG